MTYLVWYAISVVLWASMLTVVEVIELLLGRTPLFGKKTIPIKRMPSDTSGQPSDTSEQHIQVLED